MKLRLAHLTDVHLAPLPPVGTFELMSKRALGYVSWHRFRKQKHRREVLDAVVADLHLVGPDHTVVTGDLTNISLSEEFGAAARWLARLGPPERVTVVPGNHDAYVPGAAELGWPLWAAYMRGDRGNGRLAFPFVRRLPGVAIVGLSTARPTPPGYASGRLGSRQRAELKTLLDDLRREGLARVVLIHHPPVHGWSDDRKALTDSRRFRDLLAQHGAELLLCGHEHVLNVGTIDGPGGTVPVVGGPAASLMGLTPETSGGYLLYELTRTGDEVEITAAVRRWDPADGRVREIATLQLAPGRAETLTPSGDIAPAPPR